MIKTLGAIFIIYLAYLLIMSYNINSILEKARESANELTNILEEYEQNS